MAETEMHLRPATITDAPHLAELVNYAGKGMPLHLWQKLAEPGETSWNVGRRRASREEGSFSYRKATIIEHEGKPAGCLIGYEIPDAPEPMPADMPAMFVPLQELENMAPGTWYVSVLAVKPKFRRLGCGVTLLQLAETTARRLGTKGLSVIVADDNLGARRLYERCGYHLSATRPLVKDDWQTNSNEWLLLIRQF